MVSTEPIAICGSSILLPGGISSGAELFEVIRNKTQMRRDCVAAGRMPASIFEAPEDGGCSSNPYKLKTKHFNLFTEEEGEQQQTDRQTAPRCVHTPVSRTA